MVRGVVGLIGATELFSKWTFQYRTAAPIVKNTIGFLISTVCSSSASFELISYYLHYFYLFIFILYLFCISIFKSVYIHISTVFAAFCIYIFLDL